MDSGELNGDPEGCDNKKKRKKEKKKGPKEMKIKELYDTQ